MKTKDKENLKNMSPEEIRAELDNSLEKTFRIQFKRGSTPLANPMEIRQLRKRIAVVKTLIREREIKSRLAEAKKS